ncbi:MAG: NAD(P)H-binding protein [Betaproteobacteria bacterium]|nr:NAD(P)H-binding protein [Betaproteobacteria bacterium]
MRDSKTLLIVGLGDTGMRVARLANRAYRVIALVRKADHAKQAQRFGIQVIRGDLDQPHSLRSLVALGRMPGLRIVHTAPPPSKGFRDARTRNLMVALWPSALPSFVFSKRAMLPRGNRQRLVYISTSGVYGDCGGAWVDETWPLRPKTDRAARRVDAERVLRNRARLTGLRVSVLRAPGIVSESRLPLDRLKRGTPALREEDDVFVNHIHAEDLARAALAALSGSRRGRVFNCVDDAPLKMGDYFASVAARAGLPPPPRISREAAHASLPPMLYSFMGESRRLSNARIKRELGLTLKFPTIATLLDKVFGGQAR